MKSSTRYWCKWRAKGGCDRIIDNTGYVKFGYEGRVAMFENPENKTVTIILNQLRAGKDNGSYWCMSDELKEQQSSTELKLVEGKSCALAPACSGGTEPPQVSNLAFWEEQSGFLGRDVSSRPELTPAPLKLRRKVSVLWEFIHRKFS